MPVLTPHSDKFITEKELADKWRTSRRTLQRKRASGEAPPFHFLNGRILYDYSDVLEFERKNRKRSGH